MPRRVDTERLEEYERQCAEADDLFKPEMPKRKFRRFTARKQRRREEQRAFDTVYRLLGQEGAREYVERGLVTRQLRKHVWTDPKTNGVSSLVVGRQPNMVYTYKTVYRGYQCPRCEGRGDDPEHTGGGYFSPVTGEGEPPGPVPCEFCSGEGVIYPLHFWHKRHHTTSKELPKLLSGNDRLDAFSYAIHGLKRAP